MNTSSSQKKESATAAEILKSPFLLAILLLSVAYAPVLIVYLKQLWSREYYQFFPFAFLTTLWFAATRAAGEPDFSGATPRQAGRWVVLVTAVMLTVLGSLQGSPWLCYAGYVLHLALLLELWQEEGSLRRLGYVVLPVLLTVRPPLNLDETAIQKLQMITSQFASKFLSALGIDHILSGNIIQPMKGPALLVEEACSGVQSLFTVMFIASFVGVARQYSLVRSLILISTAVFWALLMNICRVLAIAIAQTQFAVDLTSGWKHDAVGYAAMLLAIPLFLSTDRFLGFLFGGIPDDPRMYEKMNLFVMIWNFLFTAPTKTVRRSGGAGQSVEEDLVWSCLPKTRRLVLIMVAVLVIASALPAWFLPGFLRSL